MLGFDSERSLQRWQESDERAFWAEHAEELSDGLPRVANITGTAQEQPLSLALSPIEEFVRTSISGIGLLLAGHGWRRWSWPTRVCSDTYESFWLTEVTIGSAAHGITDVASALG